MKERHSYVGILNGVNGVWCDKKPEGLEVIKENIFFVPDEGKIFKKGEEYTDCVIVTDGFDINDFVEIKDPRIQEQTEE